MRRQALLFIAALSVVGSPSANAHDELKSELDCYASLPAKENGSFDSQGRTLVMTGTRANRRGVYVFTNDMAYFWPFPGEMSVQATQYNSLSEEQQRIQHQRDLLAIARLDPAAPRSSELKGLTTKDLDLRSKNLGEEYQRLEDQLNRIAPANVTKLAIQVPTLKRPLYASFYTVVPFAFETGEVTLEDEAFSGLQFVAEAAKQKVLTATTQDALDNESRSQLGKQILSSFEEQKKSLFLQARSEQSAGACAVLISILDRCGKSPGIKIASILAEIRGQGVCGDKTGHTAPQSGPAAAGAYPVH